MYSFAWCAATRRLLCFVAAVFAIAAASPSAKAAFHLWGINEIYSNSSGSLQFIELTDPFGGQNFVANQLISASNIGNTQTHSFTLPNANLPGNSLNHSLLFGTAGIAAAGGPTPDYIIPNGFLFTAGGSISFFGLNSGGYLPLPTDGVQSRIWNGGNNAVNSPTNYAGQTGSVPAPGTLGLAAAGGWLALRSRRRPAGPSSVGP